jgi:hypothetical protein
MSRVRGSVLSFVVVAALVALVGVPAGWYDGDHTSTVCEARFGQASRSSRPGQRCPDDEVRGAVKVAARFQSAVRDPAGDVCALLPANFQSSYRAAARQNGVSCRVEALRESGVTFAQALQPITGLLISHSSRGDGAVIIVGSNPPVAHLTGFALAIARSPGGDWHLNQIGYQP